MRRMVLLEFQKKSSDRLLQAEDGCRGQYETEFPTLTPRIYTILAGCVGIPSPAHSAPFLHLHYNTRWHNYTFFSCYLFAQLVYSYFTSMNTTYFTFLVIATYCYFIINIHLTYLLINKLCLVIALTTPQCPCLLKCPVGNPQGFPTRHFRS